MKTEININSNELSEEVARKVLAVIKPLLKNGGVEPDTIFTVETLSDYLHVKPQWVYERTSLKEIPYAKMGKFPRFKKSDIDKWLESQKIPAMNPLSRKLKIIK